MLYDFGSRSGAFKKGIQFEADDDFKYTKENGFSFSLNIVIYNTKRMII